MPHPNLVFCTLRHRGECCISGKLVYYCYLLVFSGNRACGVYEILQQIMKGNFKVILFLVTPVLVNNGFSSEIVTLSTVRFCHLGLDYRRLF
jgi:hypothetical protein